MNYLWFFSSSIFWFLLWVLIRFLSVRVQPITKFNCSSWRIVVLISSNLVPRVLVEMYKFQE